MDAVIVPVRALNSEIVESIHEVAKYFPSSLRANEVTDDLLSLTIY